MQMTKRNSRQGKFKGDALRLAEGPHLAGYVIQHSDAYRLLLIDGALMRFTPNEYSLLLRLLQHSERHLSFALLEQCLFLRSLNCTHRRRGIAGDPFWPIGAGLGGFLTEVGGATRATPSSTVAMQTSSSQNENTSSWHCWHLSYLFMRCVDRPISLSASVSAALIISLVCLLKQCQFTCKLLAFPCVFLSC